MIRPHIALPPIPDFAPAGNPGISFAAAAWSDPVFSVRVFRISHDNTAGEWTYTNGSWADTGTSLPNPLGTVAGDPVAASYSKDGSGRYVEYFYVTTSNQISYLARTSASSGPFQINLASFEVDGPEDPNPVLGSNDTESTAGPAQTERPPSGASATGTAAATGRTDGAGSSASAPGAAGAASAATPGPFSNEAIIGLVFGVVTFVLGVPGLYYARRGIIRVNKSEAHGGRWFRTRGLFARILCVPRPRRKGRGETATAFGGGSSSVLVGGSDHARSPEAAALAKI